MRCIHSVEDIVLVICIAFNMKHSSRARLWQREDVCYNRTGASCVSTTYGRSEVTHTAGVAGVDSARRTCLQFHGALLSVSGSVHAVARVEPGQCTVYGM